ncbi:heterokaryon incompatibility protein-domain-containing protein [Xylariales sp. PMI_506]|nr:heterokaryon incompatibility protein-domain-containing protein [Xylariales sp. PMI_506]
MLCETCWLMLRGQDRRQWKGTYDLHFDHHGGIDTLAESASRGCGICRVLYDEIPQNHSHGALTENGAPAAPESSVPVSTASLAVIQNAMDDLVERDDSEETYRLDFKLEYGDIRKKKTFVLKQIGTASASFRTPISDNTASGEVLKLAMRWVTECKCVQHKPNWYPSRLIDLSALKSEAYGKAYRSRYTGKHELVRLEDIKVKLVETKEGSVAEQLQDRHYVTLSHRWGAPGGVQPLLLKQSTLERFKEGIRLGELPKTFRDAIEFAAHFTGIWYIWIDSLCIIQDSAEDWLKESALMHKVYSESFLNISATSAENSAQGLYSGRAPKLLWEDEVNLNIEGLPGSKILKSKSTRRSSGTHKSLATLKKSSATWLTNPLWSPFNWFVKTSGIQRANTMPVAKDAVAQLDLGSRRAVTMSLEQHDYIRRCIIVDASFWDTLVNQASVNRRGWVLQERLLAPRVLHFCEGQIAWECSEFDLAEGLPPGMPNFRTRRDNVFEEIQFKGLEPERHGKALRRNRLQGADEPDPHLLPSIYPFEIWNRIVETYSKTALTQGGDKLIALAGIARRMSEIIGCDYVAGLWDKYLASQLLWRVEPLFHHISRSFSHPSTRPDEYRAPSFSWASIDTELGNGVTCGEVTDQDILVDIESVEIALSQDQADHKFGLIAGGCIMLWGHLRKIKLEQLPNGRHRWFLLDREIVQPGLDVSKLHQEKHTNVYLDCPDHDEEHYGIFDADDTYCVPVSRGDRVALDESKYLNCLLLKSAQHDSRGRGHGTFRRIGLTKLSPWADKLAREYILESSQADITLPHYGHGYNEENGKHLICLI